MDELAQRKSASRSPAKGPPAAQQTQKNPDLKPVIEIVPRLDGKIYE
jgi:hypothetical protein